MFAQDSTDIRFPFLYGNKFFVEEYADAYAGRAKVLRLKAIADNCGKENEDLELEALKIGYDEAKKGKDVKLFGDIADKINGRLGSDYRMDVEWCMEVTANWKAMKPIVITNANKAHDEYLVEASYKISAIDACKEAVDIHYIHGEIEEAKDWNKQSLRCCGDSNDLRRWDCLIRGHLLDIETECYQDAKDNASLEHDLCDDFFYASAMNLSNGLVSFLEGNYYDAAYVFLDTDEDLGNRFSSLLADHDIACYGTLCAISIFEDPNQLRTKLLEYPDFDGYLDSNLEIKELLNDFYSRNYFSLFRRLDCLGQWLSFDIYMSHHFKPLCKIIRHNCLIHYVQAFSSITLTSMADTFNMTVEGLKEELVALIEANKIQASIDTSDNVLYAPK